MVSTCMHGCAHASSAHARAVLSATCAAAHPDAVREEFGGELDELRWHCCQIVGKAQHHPPSCRKRATRGRLPVRLVDAAVRRCWRLR